MFDVNKSFNFMKFFEIPKTLYVYCPDVFIESELLPEKIRNEHFKEIKDKVCPKCGTVITKTIGQKKFNVIAEIDSSEIYVDYNFFERNESKINEDYKLKDVAFTRYEGYFFDDDAYFYCGTFKKGYNYLFTSYEETIEVLKKNNIKNILVFDKKENFKKFLAKLTD